MEEERCISSHALMHDSAGSTAGSVSRTGSKNGVAAAAAAAAQGGAVVASATSVRTGAVLSPVRTHARNNTRPLSVVTVPFPSTATTLDALLPSTTSARDSTVDASGEAATSESARIAGSAGAGSFTGLRGAWDAAVAGAAAGRQRAEAASPFGNAGSRVQFAASPTTSRLSRGPLHVRTLTLLSPCACAIDLKESPFQLSFCTLDRTLLAVATGTATTRLENESVFQVVAFATVESHVPQLNVLITVGSHVESHVATVESHVLRSQLNPTLPQWNHTS